ncbi:MAG: hypothetical protein M3Q07_10610 [Pseudobdellovibrionaceae bacterium]|nr:hypothetical protein [Pseudobdellovibrionaceae bacterium]
MKSSSILLASTLIALSGCGKSPATGTLANTDSGSDSAQGNYLTALQLWRNDLPSKHPKGSCAGCHGANFFDLARSGSAESDIVRRALVDGATAEEAEALRVAIVEMRQALALPTANARTFRPFQPGGNQLLPDLNEAQWNKAAVKRDIAFAENLSKLMPTFYGKRISTLAEAVKARDEMLDIARGANTAGANSQQIQLRDLPVGIEYPLWSSDKFHASSEGTFNDWLSDLAFVPKPESKVAWEALQNAYLDNPNNDTFWAMYSAVDSMLQLATPSGTCTAKFKRGEGVNQDLCKSAPSAFKHKFKSSLIAQHMMKLDALGRRGEFMQGPIAFSYLDLDAKYKTVPKAAWGGRSMLPSPMWEVGDHLGRSVVGALGGTSLGEGTNSLGLPKFVVDSIDPSKGLNREANDLRLPWMWIGFTFDPTCQRIAPTSSTRVAEYLVGSLNEGLLFNHNAFMTHMRMISGAFLEESWVNAASTSTGVQRLVTNDRMQTLLDYSYFFGYGRNVANFGYDQWKESVLHGGAGKIPDELKARSLELWSTLVSNGSRAVLLLFLDELQNRPAGLDKQWLDKAALGIEKAGGLDKWKQDFRDHWAKFQPEYAADDDALLKKVGQAIITAASAKH